MINKIKFFFVILFVFVLTGVSVVEAKIYSLFTVTHGSVASGCDSDVDICVDPGGSFTGSAYIEFQSGFPSPLPAVGIGKPGLGYFPADFPLASCTATGGTGPGNSTSDGRICEITFNNPNAGSGTANFTVTISSTAERGKRYDVGYTTNGGSNVLTKNFVLQIKRVCSISSFTADSSTVASGSGTTLRFSLSNNYPWTITRLAGSINPSPSSGSSSGGTSSTGNLTSSHTYRLTCDGKTTRDVTVSVQGTPSLEAVWGSNNQATLNLEVTPSATQETILPAPFIYWNSGTADLTGNGCRFDVGSKIPQSKIILSPCIDGGLIGR